jgi:hypothetical protein
MYGEIDPMLVYGWQDVEGKIIKASWFDLLEEPSSIEGNYPMKIETFGESSVRHHCTKSVYGIPTELNASTGQAEPLTEEEMAYVSKIFEKAKAFHEKRNVTELPVLGYYLALKSYDSCITEELDVYTPEEGAAEGNAAEERRPKRSRYEGSIIGDILALHGRGETLPF